MQFNVPQFIDTEDKIVGPLTAKQLGWMGIAGVFILVSWSLLDTSAFIIVAIIVAIIFGALAFYRPYNQPLVKFIISSVSFFTRPKVYVWKRYYDNKKTVEKKVVKPKEEKPKQKSFDSNRISEISKMLDKN